MPLSVGIVEALNDAVEDRRRNEWTVGGHANEHLGAVPLNCALEASQYVGPASADDIRPGPRGRRLKPVRNQQ